MFSFVFATSAIDCGFNETGKQRMIPHPFPLKLRVLLHRYKPALIAYLDHLDKSPVPSIPGEAHPMLAELVAVLVVEFITVTVPLVNLIAAVALMGQCLGYDLGRLATEPHGAAKLCDVLLFVQQTDHRMWRVFVEFA